MCVNEHLTEALKILKAITMVNPDKQERMKTFRDKLEELIKEYMPDGYFK